MEQHDLDLAVFAKLSAEVQLGYEDGAADEWEASPFGWIRREPSRRKGAIGEALVRDWATQEGMKVERPIDSGHDCRIDGVAVQIKFSLIWGGGGFVFQQIRDQTYEVACLLGLEPQRVHLWAVRKSVLWHTRRVSTRVPPRRTPSGFGFQRLRRRTGLRRTEGRCLRHGRV